MELFLIPGGIVLGLAVVFFIMWKNATERADDAEDLAKIVIEQNEALTKHNDELRKKYWNLMMEGKKFDEKGGAQGALDGGKF